MIPSAILSEIFMQINHILTKLCRLKLGGPVIMPHCVIQHHKDQRYRGAQKTELNQARSKSNTVYRPVRTARSFVQLIIVHNAVTQREYFFNIPLPPDQHHISDVAKWRYGGQHIYISKLQTK